MDKLKFDYSNALSFVGKDEIDYLSDAVALANKRIKEKSGQGSDFLGWVNLPYDYDKEELQNRLLHQSFSDYKAAIHLVFHSLP